MSCVHRNLALAASPASVLLSSPQSLPAMANPPASPSDSAFLGLCQFFVCQLCCSINVLRRVSLSRQSGTEGFPNGDQRARKETERQLHSIHSLTTC